MASIGKDPGGRKRILFVAPNGKRRTIRLGKLSVRAAEGVKFRIEHLLAAKIAGHAIEADTAAWVASLEPKLGGKLAVAGLVDSPESKREITLAEHLQSYFDKRTDVKPATAINWRHTKRNLLSFFGPERPLASITAGDAKDFERWLGTSAAREMRYSEADAGEGLAENTRRKRICNAKQFFQDAVDREIITRNPFIKLKGAVGQNRKRDYFLTSEDAQKVLDTCPNAQWRLIFALSRFGGLRCPSEHLALTWEDIDWAANRFTVHSPKTEHHEGGDSRVTPLFPELRPHMEAVFDEAEPGTKYVITQYRDAGQNLRTQFQRIIKRAGLSPWPKLFQNLRASRATELASEHPAHVAAAWLGHSTLIASKHYWQITDADFEKATLEKPPERCAAQKAAQQAHVLARKDSQAKTPAHEKAPELQGFASECDTLQPGGVGDTGLEPVTSTV